MRGHNEQARRRAAATGSPTYQHEVITHWPACTDCGTPIRRNVVISRVGSWRACQCGDRWWYQATTGGWQRVNRADV